MIGPYIIYFHHVGKKKSSLLLSRALAITQDLAVEPIFQGPKISC